MIERATLMKEHLDSYGVKHHKRIPGLTPDTCNLLMYECSCNRVSINDIAILCSHVNALYTALHDTSPTATQSEYFVIIEDDIRFQFRIEFDTLIAAAPNDFGALQLMMSRKQDVGEHWNRYLAASSSSRPQSAYFSYRPKNSTVWSAQAILYKKEAIRKFIDYAVVADRHGRRGFKLVNTFDYKVTPVNRFNNINRYRPSIFSDCIFADMFLYSMAHPTYILNIPIFNSHVLGMNSSCHQSHVKHHVHGFSRIQDIQNSLRSGDAPLPPFIKPLESMKFKNSNTSYSFDSVNWRDIAAQNPLSAKEMHAQKIRND